MLNVPKAAFILLSSYAKKTPLVQTVSSSEQNFKEYAEPLRPDVKRTAKAATAQVEAWSLNSHKDKESHCLIRTFSSSIFLFFHWLPILHQVLWRYKDEKARLRAFKITWEQTPGWNVTNGQGATAGNLERQEAGRQTLLYYTLKEQYVYGFNYPNSANIIEQCLCTKPCILCFTYFTSTTMITAMKCNY